MTVLARILAVEMERDRDRRSSDVDDGVAKLTLSLRDNDLAVTSRVDVSRACGAVMTDRKAVHRTRFAELCACVCVCAVLACALTSGYWTVSGLRARVERLEERMRILDDLGPLVDGLVEKVRHFIASQ